MTEGGALHDPAMDLLHWDNQDGGQTNRMDQVLSGLIKDSKKLDLLKTGAQR